MCLFFFAYGQLHRLHGLFQEDASSFTSFLHSFIQFLPSESKSNSLYIFLAGPYPCENSPDQGLNPCHCSDLSHRSDNPGSPTCCATRTSSNSMFLFIYFFVFSRTAHAAYGGSQARGLIRATAASLYHSHSNKGSEPRLRPTPQLTATLDP